MFRVPIIVIVFSFHACYESCRERFEDRTDKCSSHGYAEQSYVYIGIFYEVIVHRNSPVVFDVFVVYMMCKGLAIMLDYLC